MELDELIQLAENRLTHNQRLRADAVIRGDLITVDKLDTDTAKTNATLSSLRSLLP